MQATSFICDDCNCRIEDHDSPVVIYLTAGVVPMHPSVREGSVDVTDHPMPKILRDLLAKPVAREEYCAACFAKKIGHPLLDAEGNEVNLAPEA